MEVEKRDLMGLKSAVPVPVLQDERTDRRTDRWIDRQIDGLCSIK